MTAPVRGVFPGGPSRGSAGGGPPRRIRTLEDLAAGAEAVRRRRVGSRRRTRWVAGTAAALMTAGLVGYLAGRGAEPSSGEGGHPPGERETLDRVISREVNRTLLELWRMEDVERVTSAGGLR